MIDDHESIKNHASSSVFAIPGAIVIAGVIIAGAILYTGGFSGFGGQQEQVTGTGQDARQLAAQNVRPVSDDDHIRGDKNAAVVLVEFSDLECSFCKRFHGTAQRAVEEFDGQLAWVYRHFPLDSLHRKARAEAIATECVAELAGNDAFWVYVDRIFEVTPSNDGLDLNLLLDFAIDLNIDRDTFIECVAREDIAARVQEDVEDAIASGGTGTPYSVLISSNGTIVPFSGWRPYSELEAAVNALLEE